MIARICSASGCPSVAGPGGRCAAHARPAWQGSTRRATLPRGWAGIRAQVLERDGRCMCRGCRRCLGEPCGRPPTDADHIADRNDHSPDNLRALCGPCHRQKTSSGR